VLSRTEDAPGALAHDLGGVARLAHGATPECAAEALGHRPHERALRRVGGAREGREAIHRLGDPGDRRDRIAALARGEARAPLARAGRIKLAGPFLDRTGSLIVVEADSLADVWALVGRDPYVTEGIFNRVEVKPFKQVLP